MNSNSHYLDHNELIIPLKNTGNNSLFKIELKKEKFLLKKFTSKEKIKIKHEITFYDYLKKINFSNVPKLIQYNNDNNFIITSYLDPSHQISKKDYSNLLIDSADFINYLNSKEHKHLINSYPIRAVDSVDIFNKNFQLIEYRFTKYKKNLYKYNNNVSNIFNHAYLYFLKIKQLLEKKDLNFLYTNKIISPSDFGFHNCIITETGTYFIDFEYAGSDYLIKLVSDFILQPRCELKKNEVKFFIDRLDIINDNLKENLNLVYPLFAIKWILIFINFLDDDNVEKLKSKSNNIDLDFDLFVNEQLSKTTRYFNMLESNYEIY